MTQEKADDLAHAILSLRAEMLAILIARRIIH